MDGHVYWQHPSSREARNTPMINDTPYSTVACLSLTALTGKLYIVSEINHPFPHDWASEAIPTIAAYACLQDWDGIFWYTFEPKHDVDRDPYVGAMHSAFRWTR
jgi:hypothetical protein